jgi:uncharacterized protein
VVTLHKQRLVYYSVRVIWGAEGALQQNLGKDLAQNKTSMITPTFEEALHAGASCFNRGAFFEAHEAWEVRWLMETGDTKRFLHGLIQIAAGFVKLNIKEWPSADGLFHEAQEKLEGFPATIYGVELEPLLEAVARCQGEVRLILRGVFDSFDLSQIPQLELTE